MNDHSGRTIELTEDNQATAERGGDKAKKGRKKGDNSKSVTYWELGLQWITGLGHRDYEFEGGDYATELLKKHKYIEEVREIIRNNDSNNGPLEEDIPYDLSGIEGIWKYMKDYSNIITLGNTGNLAVTFLGTYNLSYKVTSVGEKSITVNFEVFNSSTAASAFRPPYFGYLPIWNKTVGNVINSIFSNGPMSKTTQTFRWTETINREKE